MFSGEYVNTMDKVPIARLENALPYLELERNFIVADYGCGSGRLLDCIHDKIGQYYGIDSSEEFISFAKQRVSERGITNGKFECCDIVPFCESHANEFDAAFTFDFSSYLDDQSFLSTCRTIRKSLKQGGKLYIYIANGNFFLEILKRNGLFKQIPAPYLIVRNNEQYLELLNELSFSSIKTYYVPHFNILRMVHFLSYMPFIGKFLKAKLMIVCTK